MKFTLIIVLSISQYLSSSSGTSTIIAGSTSNGTGQSTSGPMLTLTTSAGQKVVKIPMPDLKACLDARHQFDDYERVIAVACSADQ